MGGGALPIRVRGSNPPKTQQLSKYEGVTKIGAVNF